MKYKVWVHIEHYPETEKEEEPAAAHRNQEPEFLASFKTLEQAQEFTTKLGTLKP